MTYIKWGSLAVLATCSFISLMFIAMAMPWLLAIVAMGVASYTLVEEE
jgi:hypothetical protein